MVNKLVGLLLLLSIRLYCLDIPDASLNINLSDNWKYFGKENVNNFLSYQYKRSAIENDKNEPIIPTISIYIQENPDKTDTLTYFSRMRSVLGLTNDKVKITTIDSEEGYFKLPYAVGVIGDGIPKNYEREMILILIVFEYGDYLASIICSCTKDTYPKMEKEFISILNSMVLKSDKKVVNFVRIIKDGNIIIMQPEIGIGMVLKKVKK
jgi:hypothetical protein